MFPLISPVPSPTVTMRMLLTMTSGISHTSCSSFETSEGNWAYSNCGMDHAADAIDIPLRTALRFWKEGRTA